MGTIDLDPCSNAASAVRALVDYRLDRGQDGLALPWRASLTYVNPPYGREVNRWVCKAVAEYDAGNAGQAGKSVV